VGCSILVLVSAARGRLLTALEPGRWEDRAQVAGRGSLTGPYLGQTPPGTTAALFAPGLISTADEEVCVSFSPDGKELFYTLGGPPHSVVVRQREINGVWGEPSIATFSGRYSSEGQMSPDGTRFFFSSGTPASGRGTPKGKWDIWVVSRGPDGTWGEPLRLPVPWASDDFSADAPSVAANGNLYFYSSDRPGGQGKGDLYVSRLENGSYQPPVNLDSAVNTEFYEMDPFIAPDETFLLFSSARPGGSGENDLYISRRSPTGPWRPAANLGPAVNSASMETHPFLSRDGKYLFFCSTRRQSSSRFSDPPLRLAAKLEWLRRPGNGAEDIYWVDAGGLSILKTTSLAVTDPGAAGALRRLTQELAAYCDERQADSRSPQ
jgi:Tol biopolymer transport system component